MPYTQLTRSCKTKKRIGSFFSYAGSIPINSDLKSIFLSFTGFLNNAELKKMFGCHRGSNPELLALRTSTLPLSYNNQTNKQTFYFCILYW